MAPSKHPKRDGTLKLPRIRWHPQNTRNEMASSEQPKRDCTLKFPKIRWHPQNTQNEMPPLVCFQDLATAAFYVVLFHLNNWDRFCHNFRKSTPEEISPFGGNVALINSLIDPVHFCPVLSLCQLWATPIRAMFRSGPRPTSKIVCNPAREAILLSSIWPQPRNLCDMII